MQKESMFAIIRQDYIIDNFLEFLTIMHSKKTFFLHDQVMNNNFQWNHQLYTLFILQFHYGKYHAVLILIFHKIFTKKEKTKTSFSHQGLYLAKQKTNYISQNPVCSDWRRG